MYKASFFQRLRESCRQWAVDGSELTSCASASRRRRGANRRYCRHGQPRGRSSRRRGGRAQQTARRARTRQRAHDAPQAHDAPHSLDEQRALRRSWSHRWHCSDPEPGRRRAAGRRGRTAAEERIRIPFEALLVLLMVWDSPSCCLDYRMIRIDLLGHWRGLYTQLAFTEPCAGQSGAATSG